MVAGNRPFPQESAQDARVSTILNANQSEQDRSLVVVGSGNNSCMRDGVAILSDKAVPT